MFNGKVALVTGAERRSAGNRAVAGQRWRYGALDLESDSHRGRFPGRVAIVTGSSRGIGLAIARRLVVEGARVCLTGRAREPLQQAVRELGTDGQAIGVAGSADDVDHQREAVARTIEAFDRMDMLVNNAGSIRSTGPFWTPTLLPRRRSLQSTFWHRCRGAAQLETLGWDSTAA